MDLRTKTKLVQKKAGMRPSRRDGVWGPETASAVLHALEKANGEAPAESMTPPGELDPRSEKVIRGLDPKARRKFRRFTMRAKAVAASMGCDYKAINGFRSWEEQDALYAKGRTKPGRIVTKARGGYSNHNFGIAVDYGVFKGGRYMDDENPALAEKVHAAVGALAPDYGIEWGGAWRRFKDEPHFQITTGLTMAQKRSAWKKRGSVL